MTEFGFGCPLLATSPPRLSGDIIKGFAYDAYDYYTD